MLQYSRVCLTHRVLLLAPQRLFDGLPHAIVDASFGDEHTRALLDHDGQPGVSQGQRQIFGEVGEDGAKPGFGVTDLSIYAQ